MTNRELAGEYWWCQKHDRVERYEDTDSTQRIGPFPTAAEAARALEIVHDRNERWDREDAEWDDD